MRGGRQGKQACRGIVKQADGGKQRQAGGGKEKQACDSWTNLEFLASCIKNRLSTVRICEARHCLPRHLLKRQVYYVDGVVHMSLRVLLIQFSFCSKIQAPTYSNQQSM